MSLSMSLIPNSLQGEGTCSLTELMSAFRSMRTRSTSAIRSVRSPVMTTPPGEQPVEQVDESDLPAFHDGHASSPLNE